MTKAQQEEKREAIERLRELLKPGQEVLCILRHVSRSGMQRVIDLKVVNARGEIEGIGWSAALALSDRYDRKRDGIVIGGAGMDMGFHLVYSLARTLWPDGHPCAGRNCPSNDHTNGDRDYRENMHNHTDGGYALKHRWL